MEMTSDIDAFAERSAAADPPDTNDDDDAKSGERTDDDEDERDDYEATATDQSTLRTLIAAWLHAGEVHRAVSLVANSRLFAEYYHPTAFLRTRAMQGFLRQLRVLDEVRMVVDTMAVLTSPRLEDLGEGEEELLVAKSAASHPTHHHNPQAPSLSSAHLFSSSALPRHLDFHRNESFAASLRSERERRKQSWERIMEADESAVDATLMVHRVKGGVTDDDVAQQKELHHLARVFYAGTNMLALRNAARRTVDEDQQSNDVQVSLMTVETASSRRRFEVPDDDSSFLLRAQVSNYPQSFVREERETMLMFFLPL